MELDLVTLIGQLGFPIAVASYTLIKLDQTIKENTKCMMEMKGLIQSLAGGEIKNG
ncbi:YvrJ family protein [Dehalobacter sp. DCM]|uniref:YvrJ family protein n=1 Tax=Dehalobacter sp. DCM TaxID=2907827 RepID=UPI003081D772|nr:YvrJ family protein [Dehalobacter sp. DCM]